MNGVKDDLLGSKLETEREREEGGTEREINNYQVTWTVSFPQNCFILSRS